VAEQIASEGVLNESGSSAESENGRPTVAAVSRQAGGLQDEDLQRAERMAFFALASELTRGRQVLVVENGDGVLAHVAEHFDSRAVGELAAVADGGYTAVVADISAADDDIAASAPHFARIVEASSGVALIRVPNRPELAGIRDAIAAGFANTRALRQHNWVASALFDDAQFAADDPGNAIPASLRKLAAAEPGEELYTLLLCGHGELPATPPQLALTRSAALRQLVDQLHRERETAKLALEEQRAINATQERRLAELELEMAWLDEHELTLRESAERHPWLMRLLVARAGGVTLWRRARNFLNR
jgi:hypothetical protein